MFGVHHHTRNCIKRSGHSIRKVSNHCSRETLGSLARCVYAACLVTDWYGRPAPLIWINVEPSVLLNYIYSESFTLYRGELAYIHHPLHFLFHFHVRRAKLKPTYRQGSVPHVT